jgi:hypothetical protein
LDGFDGILGCEPSHKQCQLAVKCHLDGSPINPLHVLSGMGAATIYFHNKFGAFHEFSSRSGSVACLLKRLGRVLLPLRFQPSRPLLIGLWLYNGLIVVMVVMVFRFPTG